MSLEMSDAVRKERRQDTRKVNADLVWKIEWNDSLSLGIPAMDAENRRFIGLVNDLNAALIDRKPKADIQKVLREMLADANRHFQHEEQLFARYGYPDARHHSELHPDIIAALTEVMEEFEKDDLSMVWVKCGLLIKQTLVNHLLEEDVKYLDWLGSSYRSMREMTIGGAGFRQAGS